jgi:hypothetical protein
MSEAKTTDVVGELEHWLAANRDYPMGMLVGAMQRARDEIEALREAMRELLDAGRMISTGTSTDRDHYRRYERAEQAAVREIRRRYPRPEGQAMSDPDVVAELRHWLNQGVCPPLQLVRCAVSEIEALRRHSTLIGLATQNPALPLADWIRTARAEALEEAAQACEQFSPAHGDDNWRPQSERYAAAIRALKDKP